MNSALVDLEATSDDRLLGGRVTLRQPRDGYRVAIDPILLAAAVPVNPGDTVLELGSGSGAASLCLHHRVPDCDIVGLEIDPELVELAGLNAHLNRAEERVKFLRGDIVDIPSVIGAGDFDHVFCNPPYLQPERADQRIRGNSKLAVANLESTASLDVWVAAMASVLKPKGRLTIIHRADRLDDVTAYIREVAGEIVVFPLWPKVGRDAKRVLVTARVGVATPLRVAPGLVLHTDDGEFTEEARAIIENGAPLLI